MIKRSKYIVRKDSGCWEWQGAVTREGYGRLKVNNVAWMAHRYSLMLHLGRPLVDGCVVMHSCDNPSCINPEHLAEGTQKDNMEDCRAKGRLGPRGTNRNTRPKLSASERRIQLVIGAYNRKWSVQSIAKYHRLSTTWVRKVIEDFLQA